MVAQASVPPAAPPQAPQPQAPQPVAAQPTSPQTSALQPAAWGAALQNAPPSPASPTPPAQPARPAPQRTVMGMPAMELAALHAAVAAAAQTPPPAATPPAAGPLAATAPAAAPAASARRDKPHNATMMGMSVASLPQPPQQYAPPQPAASQPQYAPPQPAAAQPQYAPPQPAAAQPQYAPPQPAASKPNIAPQTNRTMLGISLPELGQLQAEPAPPTHSPGAMPVHAQRARASVAYDSASQEDEVELPGRRGGRALLFVALAFVALLVLTASGVGLFFAVRGSGPEVRVMVMRMESGDALQVEVPAAAPGTKLRFDGQELPLQAGRATFPLAPAALHVGTNTVAVAVIAPGGDATTREIELDVDFRVHADLSELVGAQPMVAIVIDAHPGSTVLLDGAPLALPANGHAIKRYPVEASSAHDGIVTHVARYTITPPGGAAATGSVTTRIPVTTMQIDRPGLALVTDRDSVELAGAVDRTATVTVDGVPVPVTAGRFLLRLPLAALGAHTPRIVASAPGKAPHAVTLDIRRVADLAVEARSFTFDRTLSYARLKTAVLTYRGQNVALEGRVYNVEISGGRSVVQMLVRDCPRGEQCPLWVTYPAATDITVNTWIRALGTVAGEQQFRSESGRVNTVPRVDAAFLLPLPS